MIKKAATTGLYVLFVLLFFTNSMYAQWERENFPELEGFTAPDSLKKLTYKALNKLHEKHSEFWLDEGNPEISNLATLTILERGVVNQDSTLVGWGYLNMGQNITSLDYYKKALDYTNIQKPSSLKFNIYTSIVSLYNDQGNYQKSLEYALLAKDDATKRRSYINIFNATYILNFINSKWGNKNDGLIGLIEIKDIFNSKEYKEENNLSKENRNFFLYNLNYNILGTAYDIGDYELANKFLDTIYKQSQTNSDYIDAYLGMKGAVLFRQGNYVEALEHTNAYLYNNEPNEPYSISRSNVIKGLTLWQLDAKEEAMQSFHIADSIYQETKDEYEELGEAYYTMIAYYKSKNNSTKQLEYVSKLLEFNKEITSNYLDIAPTIQRAYTVPKLLEEKEALIAQLGQSNSKKSRLNWVLIGVSILFFIVGCYLLFRQWRLRKRYNALLSELEKRRDPEVAITSIQHLKDLDATQIARISIGLEQFEKDKGFIDQDLTLSKLAKNIDTNSSYLSKYVNAIKEETFSLYINNLRINYVLDILARDKGIRNYTIEAIGNEAGYSTARSFSSHFKRVTGISVSYFLKKIDKEEEIIINGIVIPQTA